MRRPGSRGVSGTLGAPQEGSYWGKPWLRAGLRVALSLGLLAFVLSSVDVGKLVSVLRQASGPHVIAAALVTVLGVGVNALKWHGLLRTLDLPLRWRDVLAANLLGGLYNLAFPGLVGGDIARGWRVKGITHNAAQTAVSLVADRVTGMTALLLLGMGGLSLAPPFAGREALRGVAVALLLALAAVGAVSLSERARLVAVRAAKWMTAGTVPEVLRGFAAQVGEALRAYRGSLGGLGRALGLALVFQTLMVVANYVACRAVTVDISVINIVWVTAAASMAVVLPISVAGLGVRETAYVTLLGQCAVSAEQGLGVSVVMLGMYCLPGLGGALVHLTGLGTRAQNGSVRPADSEEATSRSGD